jgi:hypothetical protein
MIIKILDENIENMPDYCRVEIDKKISIKLKDDVNKMIQENKFRGKRK